MMLQDRTVVITGSARGVGLVIAAACARHGARLVLGDVLNDLGIAEAEKLSRQGAQVRFVPLDIEDPASVKAFAENVGHNEGFVHGLVNNAAIATNVSGVAFDEIDIELWDRLMRVNVRGTWLMIRAFVPLMARGSDARIVNLASDTALWGAPNLLAYVASKGAVIAMTRSLARELGPRGIGIVGVAPGLLRTGATTSTSSAGHQIYETRRAVPGPQMPEDIVETIAFLLTPGALAMTGQIIPVNAGFVFT